MFRRLPFKPLVRHKVPALMRSYHSIYTDADEALLADVDVVYGKGTLRDWAVFTHTAAALCREAGQPTVDADITGNAYALLGGLE